MLERIAIDIAGWFLGINIENKNLLVIIGYFFKWVEVYALRNQEAITVAETLFEVWIWRFGVPLEIYSGNYKNSKVLR